MAGRCEIVQCGVVLEGTAEILNLLSIPDLLRQLDQAIELTWYHFDAWPVCRISWTSPHHIKYADHGILCGVRCFDDEDEDRTSCPNLRVLNTVMEVRLGSSSSRRRTQSSTPAPLPGAPHAI
jgi:hypothetical protein